MNDKQRQKINERLSVFETRAKENNMKLIDLANQEFNNTNHIFSSVSVLGPIFLSCLYLFLPIDFDNIIWWKVLIDCAATIILIIGLCILLQELVTLQAIISKIETNKVLHKKNILDLESQIEQSAKDQSFFITAAQRLAETIKDGQKDFESLGKILLSLVFMHLTQNTGHTNFSLNLYELRDNKVKMVLSSTLYRHIRQEDLDNPLLYNDNGFNIDDKTIRDYYCIKCMAGKIQGENGKYYLRDWVEIAKAFRWNKWGTQKNDILNSRNRSKSKQLGFIYNQYIGFEIKRHDGLKIFFEMIANDDAKFADCDLIDRQAYYLGGIYSPLVNILWDIAE